MGQCLCHRLTGVWTPLQETPGERPWRHPPGGPPGRGPGRGKIFPRGRPRAGAARAPPGAPRAPPGRPPGHPPGGPVWGPNPGLLYMYLYYPGGSDPPPRGAVRGCTFGPPGGAPPRGAKKCTFFWVFNNSPSRDSLGPFFGPPRDTPIWGHTPRWGPWSVTRSSPRRTGSAYRPHQTQSAPRSVTVR